MDFPDNIKNYFSLLEHWMVHFGFSSLGVKPNWLFDSGFRKDRVEASKFSKVNTYCFAKYSNEIYDTARFENFSKQCFEYAFKIRQGMPVGLGGSLIVYPCLIMDRISPELADFIQKYFNKHFAAFEFPCVLDIYSGNAYFYSKTPVWGALYYNGFRKEAREIFSPVAWNEIVRR